MPEFVCRDVFLLIIGIFWGVFSNKPSNDANLLILGIDLRRTKIRQIVEILE